MRNALLRLIFAPLFFFFAISQTALMPQAEAAGLGVTPPEQFSTLPGFQVELLYEVPSESVGSWVSLTVDPRGRLIACDQYGGLYRIDAKGRKVYLKASEQPKQGKPRRAKRRRTKTA